MLYSLEWLADHVDIGDIEPERLGELLTLHVAEVGEVVQPGGGWPGIHVGHVQAVRPHPNADKLRLVTVDTGNGEVEVVCGAPNVAEGQRICYAPEGTTLPDGLRLKKRKIRGVESRGMVLSERELGLSDEHEGIVVLDADAAIGTPVRELLAGGAVLDVENTAITTRPDLWGHYGVAREVAAVLRRELRPMDLGDELPVEASQVEVSVEAPDLCPRYLGWVIGGIRVEPSPAWLRQRLEQAGQRPINNVVDLTNYILLECGQPLHAFDRRQIAEGRIVVRRAGKGEKVTTLDGLERTLPEGACVIADPERAVAVAGVMGCANSEVMDDTTEIILEVANFEMTSIRATSKALGLRSESAIRFEKGLDPVGVPDSARRFFALLKRICPTAHPIGGACDVRVEPEPAPPITFEEGFIARRLGTEIGAADIDDILQRLGFSVRRAGGSVQVAVPSWRGGRDVSLPEDLVEEVGRIWGYDKIEPVPLLGTLTPVDEEPARLTRKLARRALSLVSGLAEITAYPFTTADDCRNARVADATLGIANAEQPGLDLMAPSLLPAVLRAAAKNQKYRDAFGLYLIAPVFEKQEDGLPAQDERIAVAVSHREGEHPVFALRAAVRALLDAFRLGSVEIRQEAGPDWLHPGRSACLARGRQIYGWLGEVHPSVARAFELDARTAVAELDFEKLRESRGRDARMKPISRYPTVPYDVAVLVDRHTPAADVESVLRRADPGLVRGVRLFDVYEGDKLPEGKRSLAFSIVFGALDRTLSTDEVDALRDCVNKSLEKRGWTLRV